jgi:hypothetical protein
MLMQIITEAAAIEYVKQLELEWYGSHSVKPYIVASYPDRESTAEFPAYTVRTGENYWTVWMEPDGHVYGEC